MLRANAKKAGFKDPERKLEQVAAQFRRKRGQAKDTEEENPPKKNKA